MLKPGDNVKLGETTYRIADVQPFWGNLKVTLQDGSDVLIGLWDKTGKLKQIISGSYNKFGDFDSHLVEEVKEGPKEPTVDRRDYTGVTYQDILLGRV